MGKPGEDVTELDFRMPQYRHEKPEDYEFRADGSIARKDRWMRAIHRIQDTVGPHRREWEIEEVVAAVEALAETATGWEEPDMNFQGSLPENGEPIDLLLDDGSILRGGCYLRREKLWQWRDLPASGLVVGWKRSRTSEQDQTPAAG